MKKIIYASLLVLFVCSCSNSLSSQFERLASKVEKKGESMSDSQWKKCNDTFLNLCDKYLKVENDLSLAEKKDIIKSSAKYSVSMMKYASESVIEEFDDIMDDEELNNLFDGISSTTEELMDGLGGLLEDAAGVLDGLFD